MAAIQNSEIEHSKYKIAEFCDELTWGSLSPQYLYFHVNVIQSHYDAIKETGAGDPVPEPLCENSSRDEKIDYYVAMIMSLTLSSEEVPEVCQNIFDLAAQRTADMMRARALSQE